MSWSFTALGEINQTGDVTFKDIIFTVLSKNGSTDVDIGMKTCAIKQTVDTRTVPHTLARASPLKAPQHTGDLSGTV